MKKYTNAELCLIWLDSFVGLEYKHKQTLYQMIQGKADIKELLEKGRDYIIQSIGEKEYSTLMHSANKEYLDFTLSTLERKGITVVTIESQDYPQSIINTPVPPLVLYCKGNVSLLSEKSIAIVGSRKSLPQSLKIAENYTETFCQNGFVVVTGIAEGVDSTVLKTALHCGEKAISVLAGGFDNLYPASNITLVQEVEKHGLVITEHIPEISPRPYLFPVRNRIIAGLSQATVVISGGIKSGTVYTAEYAEEYGREVFAVPYSIGISSGAGCNELIKKGAILTDTPQDILNFYGIENKRERVQLTPEQKEIIALLSDGEMHVENICKALNKKIFEITPIISIMEINKIIVKNGTNVYGLIRSDLEE